MMTRTMAEQMRQRLACPLEADSRAAADGVRRGLRMRPLLEVITADGLI